MKLINKILITSSLVLPLIALADTTYKGLSPSGQMVTIPSPNKNLLPNSFPVYSNGKVVINHRIPGFTEIKIPVDNSYDQNPGCYILCYSHQQKNSLYEASDDIYAHGMVRIAGKYDQNRMCHPTDAGNQDTSTMQEYQDLCNTKIKSCNGTCWAGGDTGGLYGMQLIGNGT